MRIVPEDRQLVRLSARRLGLLFPLLVSAGPPNLPGPAPEDEIVVTGHRPIVVNGRSVKCRPADNDPQDKVNAAPDGSTRIQSVLMPVYGGRRFELVPWGNGKDKWSEEFFDFKRYGGPGVWRRQGNGIDQYIFRGPQNASLLCMGAKWPDPIGIGQLGQLVDAAPYHGKRVRFTAWAASRNASLVTFYLASGALNKIGLVIDGGNTNTHPWAGSHGWTPMMIEIGPISKDATFISFGFTLHGDGDVWLYNPKLQPVEPGDAYQRSRDVFVIGNDRNDAAADAGAQR
jgi:hypothetical protein